jgi:hypothetical protein
MQKVLIKDEGLGILLIQSGSPNLGSNSEVIDAFLIYKDHGANFSSFYLGY